MLRHKRALRGFEKEFFKDVRLLGSGLVGHPASADQGIRYVLTADMLPFRAKIVQHLENLLDNENLVRWFADPAEHEAVISTLRGRMGELLEFEVVEYW